MELSNKFIEDLFFKQIKDLTIRSSKVKQRGDYNEKKNL